MGLFFLSFCNSFTLLANKYLLTYFYNPKIEKVSVTIEGKPHQLYVQGMRSFEQYDETCKYFAEGKLANEVQKSLQLYDLSVGEYSTDK